MFSNINIILVNTSHSGNIGSSARAMKTMGFENLILVNPKDFPSSHANALAVGCRDVLDKAKVFNEFNEAISIGNINIGLTARSRRASIPTLEIDDFIDMLLLNSENKFNVIFGNEKSGLSNQELLKCDYVMTLPTSSKYKSLNLAFAVQIVVYELFKKSKYKLFKSKKLPNLASSKEKNFFIETLISLLKTTKFITEKNRQSLTKKIHIIFNKANLETDEVNTLHGILSSLTKYSKK